MSSLPAPPRHARASTRRRESAARPSKTCQACQRPMTWRKAWARCWDEVRYCSDACRRRKPAGLPP